MARAWKLILWMLGGLSFLCLLGYIAFPVALYCYDWFHGEPTYNDILGLRDSHALGMLLDISYFCGFALIPLAFLFVNCGILAIVTSRHK